MCKAVDDEPILDVGKGVVDARKLLRRYLTIAKRIVLGKNISNDDGPAGVRLCA